MKDAIQAFVEVFPDGNPTVAWRIAEGNEPLNAWRNESKATAAENFRLITFVPHKEVMPLQPFPVADDSL